MRLPASSAIISVGKWVTLYSGQFKPFAMFYVHFQIDKVLVEVVATALSVKVFLGQHFARPAPGSISINKNQFTFVFGFGKCLLI